MTTRTQWVRNVADSHLNRSMLQRLSFMWPRKVSQEGPSESCPGKQCRARIVRTTSLSIEMWPLLSPRKRNYNSSDTGALGGPFRHRSPSQLGFHRTNERV